MAIDDFGPELDRFPAEIPTSPQMLAQLKSMTIAPTSTIASQTTPVLEQTKLSTGDWATILNGAATLEDDFSVVQIVNHLEYTANFPDYSSRVLKNWVLCKWASHHDHEREPEPSFHIGWFEVARLVPITEEQAHELLEVIVATGTRTHGNLTEVPNWLYSLYDKWVDKMNTASPTTMQAPATCGNPDCKSKNVDLHGVRTTRLTTRAGVLEINGKNTFVNASNVVTDSTSRMHLHCQDCGSLRILDDEDYHLHM